MTTEKKHPFVAWLVEHHGKDDTPLGDFAQEVDRSWEFPTTGTHDELRALLEDTGPEWALDQFDLAWALYDPNCMWSGCTEPKTSERLVCAKHAHADEDLL